MLLDLLLEPLSYGFMQKAFLAAIFASLNCASIGTYLVLRRMSFMGEALSHTILPGVVFAYLRGFQMFVGALGASLLTALGVSFFVRKNHLREDSAIGVVLSTMLALGIAMMSYTQSFKDFTHILFGSILGVDAKDLWLIGAISLLVLGIMYALHKELELSSFDNTYAKLIGTRPSALRTLLLILISLSVVSAVKMVGTLLTTALLIIPAVTAQALAKTLKGILFLSNFFAIVASLIGLYISFYFPIASGAAIVLSASSFFLVAYSYKGLKGFKAYQHSH
jgi:ABC-type Mn2+/Zn2+ transport system permease subunit